MFKNILVATDGSDYGKKAVDVSAAMAASAGGKLTIATVIPPLVGPQAMSAAGLMLDEEVLKVIRENYVTILAEAEAVARNLGAKNVESKLEDGSVAQTIVGLAEKANCDLIVVGSRGHSQAYSVFLGSVSDRVSHTAKISVLIVR